MLRPSKSAAFASSASPPPPIDEGTEVPREAAESSREAAEVTAVEEVAVRRSKVALTTEEVRVRPSETPLTTEAVRVRPSPACGGRPMESGQWWREATGGGENRARNEAKGAADEANRPANEAPSRPSATTALIPSGAHRKRERDKVPLPLEVSELAMDNVPLPLEARELAMDVFLLPPQVPESAAVAASAPLPLTLESRATPGRDFRLPLRSLECSSLPRCRRR